MKIVFVYQFCTLGGVETVLLGRLRALNTLGHEVRVLFLDGGGGQEMFRGFPGSVLCGASAEAAQRFVADFAPSVILFIDCPAGMEILDGISCPRVLEVHTTYPEGLRYLAKCKMDQRTAGLVVPSSGQRRFVLEQFPSLASEAIEVVANPLPPMFAELATTSVPDSPIIGWIGRLDAHKNWPRFLDLAAEVARARADVRFWVIGGLHSPGDARCQLWHEVKRRNLAARLTWLPAVDHCQMPRAYAYIGRSGGCVVSTSCNESFGMVALEALSQECPIVAPALGGFTDIATGPLAPLLFPPGDWTACRRTVQRIIGDRREHESLGTWGRKLILEQFSPDKTVHDLVRAVERLCASVAPGQTQAGDSGRPQAA